MTTRNQQPVIPEDYSDLSNQPPSQILLLPGLTTTRPNVESRGEPLWVDRDGERIKFSQSKTR